MKLIDSEFAYLTGCAWEALPGRYSIPDRLILARRYGCQVDASVHLIIPMIHQPGLGDSACRQISIPAENLAKPETFITLKSDFPDAWGGFCWLGLLPHSDDHPEYVYRFRRYAALLCAGWQSTDPASQAGLLFLPEPTRSAVAAVYGK